jgi:hypothetical protein
MHMVTLKVVPTAAKLLTQVMSPPVPALDVSIATPTPGAEPDFGFNPNDVAMRLEDKDVNPPDDTAHDEHAPASGKAATKSFKFPKDMSDEENQYVRAVQKFFKYSEATVNDQRENHKWPIRYMYDNLGQYEEFCPKEVKKLRRMDQEQLEQLLSCVNWQGAEDIKYQKNHEGVGDMHLLSVDHKEAYSQPFDLPQGLKNRLKTIITKAEIELGKLANRKPGEADYCLLADQQEILATAGAIWGWAPGQSFWESRVRPHGYHGLQIEEYNTNKVAEEFITWTREFYDLIFTQSQWGSVAWTVPSWNQRQ